jgi:hypothetical protein
MTNLFLLICVALGQFLFQFFIDKIALDPIWKIRAFIRIGEKVVCSHHGFGNGYVGKKLDKQNGS